MKGEIAAVNEATGKMSIKQNPGTVGSGSATAATEFKVQDLPPPIGKRAPQTIRVDLTTVEPRTR